LRRDDQVVTVPFASQRVLALVALENRKLHRSYVAGKLWLETSEEHAQACLRSALWRIRARCPLPPFESTRTHVWLAPTVDVDVHRQVSLAQSLISGDLSCDDVEPGMIELDDLLPGWYDDAVLLERERLQQLHLHAIEALSKVLVAERRYAEAVEAAFAAIAVDPLRESARRTLIAAYLSEGNVAVAVRHGRAYAELVRRTLGVDPSREFRELLDGIAVWC
jgi:DNA-binding SARP family transcriptional activator